MAVLYVSESVAEYPADVVCQTCALMVAYGDVEGFTEYPDYLDGIRSLSPMLVDGEPDWFFGTCSLCDTPTDVTNMVLDYGD